MTVYVVYATGEVYDEYDSSDGYIAGVYSSMEAAEAARTDEFGTILEVATFILDGAAE